MKTLLGSVAIGIGALLCQGVYAQDSAGHTALCKDGTYFDGATHKGACRGHQGVKEWLDKTTAKGDAKTDATSAEIPAVTARAVFCVQDRSMLCVRLLALDLGYQIDHQRALSERDGVGSRADEPD